MKKSRLARCVLTVCILASMLGISVLADGQAGYPVEIHIMTLEEQDTLMTLGENEPMPTAILLPPNNSEGTNGAMCNSFSADAANMAFVLTAAPGALDYNVQLYVGLPGEGEKASDYATVMLGGGVYFTGLTVGENYYVKISSSTLTTNGSNARYIMNTYES